MGGGRLWESRSDFQGAVDEAGARELHEFRFRDLRIEGPIKIGERRDGDHPRVFQPTRVEALVLDEQLQEFQVRQRRRLGLGDASGQGLRHAGQTQVANGLIAEMLTGVGLGDRAQHPLARMLARQGSRNKLSGLRRTVASAFWRGLGAAEALVARKTLTADRGLAAHSRKVHSRTADIARPNDRVRRITRIWRDASVGATWDLNGVERFQRH